MTAHYLQGVIIPINYTDCSLESDASCYDDGDRILSIEGLVERKTNNGGTELYAKVNWEQDGEREDLFFFVREDAPDLVENFLKENPGEQSLVRRYEIQKKERCELVRIKDDPFLLEIHKMYDKDSILYLKVQTQQHSRASTFRFTYLKENHPEAIEKFLSKNPHLRIWTEMDKKGKMSIKKFSN